MPAWGNNDNANSKPKFSVERQTREVTFATTANLTAAQANTILFTGLTAPAGVTVGQYVYVANLSSGGVAGFFKSNNTVSVINGNLVSFTANTFGTIASGSTIEFDSAINYGTSKTVEANLWSDTILVTDGRLANTANGGYPNTAYAFGNLNSGWNKITKKTNNDGAVRYLRETLVVLATPTASNTNSGNTSWGQAYTGL